MGGNFIETEASRIYHEGEKRGEARGEERKSRKTTLNLYAMGLSSENISRAVEVDTNQVQQWIRG